MKPLTGSGDGRRGRRRRLLLGGLAVGIVVIAALAGARVSHEVGVAQGRTGRDRLLADLEAQQRLSRALAERAAVAEQRAAAAAERATELRGLLDAASPTAELRPLIDLLKERLAGGVPPERLEFVLREIRGERACEPASERKRLRVQIPTSADAPATAGFAANRVAVAAEGSAAPRGSAAAASGGFDPARAVTIRFRPIGREASTVTGVLPLSHAIVLEATEVLFLARADERVDRLEITAQACRFP